METPPVFPSPPPITPDYRDRRGGLIFFGISEIILGAFCALMVPLTLFGQIMVARQSGHEPMLYLLMPTVLIFAGLGVGLIWLGIGSIQARRWARTLLLCLSWIGLVTGILSLISLVLNSGAMRQAMLQQGGNELPAAGANVIVAMTVTFAAIIYVVIPGALLLFYRSYHVRRTCEVRDPQQRWTDRCPLPVLIMCLLQISGSLCFLIMPRFWSVIPFFGTLVTGWPARLLWIILIIVSLCAARGFYRLNFHAWLVYLLTVVACLTSTGITFIHIELIDYYRAIDLPEWHLEMMAKNPLATGNYAFASTILSPVAFVGYLIYLRRYFTTR